MSPAPRSGGRTLARAGAAVSGLAAAAYGAQRVAAARLRRRSDPHAGRPHDLDADVTHDLESHDGGSIHVIERGSGMPLVFSHGVTLSARTWVRQFESMPQDGFRVIAFDHRGHGSSTTGATGHSVENLAWDFRTVLEGLDLTGAVIIGHSMGGIAAQAFAVTHPKIMAARVGGIVLLSTIASTPLADPRAARVKAVVSRITGAMPDTSVIWGARNLGLLLARVGFGRDAKPSDVELVRQMMLDCPSETRREAPRSILGVDLTSQLGSIEVPTLVIGGTADVITPPWEARRVASLIPGARCELFEGGGHMLMLEQPDRLNSVIEGFAREVANGRVGDADHGRAAGSAPRAGG